MTTESANELSITSKAAHEIKAIMAENNIPSDFALRIDAKNGGCSGLTYSLGFDDKLSESDVVIEAEGLKVYVDGRSLFLLNGTVLDFAENEHGKGFVFNNPNRKKACGCGDSSCC